MKPLIDGDILAYEIGHAAVVGYQSEYPPWSYVADLLNARIEQICFYVKATEKPAIYLTASGVETFRHKLYPDYKKKRKYVLKPFHYLNIRTHLKGAYDTIEVSGIEADDALAIEQYKNLGQDPPTIICTRDKDLRMIPGWHYSWELGNQPSWGPIYVVDPGYLNLEQKKSYKSLNGTGLAWFYAQMLMGDKVDDIPGIPKCGPVKTYNILKDFYDEEDLKDRVMEQYHCYYGADAEIQYELTAQLVWVIREESNE